MGRKGISRDGDAKPVPGKPYLLRKDGSRVPSKSSKGWDKDGKYEANKEKYQGGTLDTLQQDRRVHHAEEGGQLAIPDMIIAMAREEGAEVYFSDHDGNNMVVFSLDAFAKLSDKVTYVHMRANGTETENKQFDDLSDFAKLLFTFGRFNIGSPKGQRVYAGEWVDRVTNHGKVYFFHEQFHANGNTAGMRQQGKRKYLAKKIAYEKVAAANA